MAVESFAPCGGFATTSSAAWRGSSRQTRVSRRRRAARAKRQRLYGAGADRATLLMALDLDGVAVSSGSACSSGKMSDSHVLEAMGAQNMEALRVSLGWSSTPKDVETFLKALARVVDRLRSRPSAA